MKLWSTALTVNNVSFARVHINRGIFQGDSLSPLLFIMCLTPLSDILNCTGKGFHISGSSSVVRHLVYMDDLKLYGRSQAEIESLVHTSNLYFNDICMDIGAAKV